MRWAFGMGGAIIALIVAAPAAAATPVARLSGSFTTIDTVTSAGKVVGQHNGQKQTQTWTFTPRCATGGCAVTVHRFSIFGQANSETLTPSSATQFGGSVPQSSANCYKADGSVRIAHAYATGGSIELSVTGVTNGQATSYSGTVVDSFTPDQAAHGSPFCKATSEVYSFTGTLIGSVLASPSGRPSVSPSSVASAAAPTIAAPTPTPSATVAPPAKAHHHAPPRRSVLASALHRPSTVFGSPLRDIVNAAIAFGAVLLITFPSQLFNHTFEEHYDEILAAWNRRLSWLTRVRRRLSRRATRDQRVLFVAVSLAGAVLGSLLNPHVGFDASTGVSFVGTLIAIAFGALIADLVPRTYRRLRGRDVTAHLKALPAGLLVAAICVLVSRLTDFQPGYLYGVIAGVAFTVELPDREEAHVVGISHLSSVLISVLAWIAWVPVNSSASAAGASWALVLLDDVLGALVVGGLVGSAINLLPLRFLPGSKLWTWRRLVDAGLLAVTLLGVVTILLNPTTHPDHGSRAPLITIIGLLVLFGGASIVFAAYWNHRDAEEEDSDDESEDAESEVDEADSSESHGRESPDSDANAPANH